MLPACLATKYLLKIMVGVHARARASSSVLRDRSLLHACMQMGAAGAGRQWSAEHGGRAAACEERAAAAPAAGSTYHACVLSTCCRQPRTAQAFRWCQCPLPVPRTHASKASQAKPTRHEKSTGALFPAPIANLTDRRSIKSAASVTRSGSRSFSTPFWLGDAG